MNEFRMATLSQNQKPPHRGAPRQRALYINSMTWCRIQHIAKGCQHTATTDAIVAGRLLVVPRMTVEVALSPSCPLGPWLCTGLGSVGRTAKRAKSSSALKPHILPAWCLSRATRLLGEVLVLQLLKASTLALASQQDWTRSCVNILQRIILIRGSACAVALGVCYRWYWRVANVSLKLHTTSKMRSRAESRVRADL